MKTVFALVLFSVLFLGISEQSFAQEKEQVPAPPPVPQPIPEPEPIPQPEPDPIEEPFPELTDEEKLEKLTEENKKLKAEKAQLELQVDELKIKKGFLENQIEQLQTQLENINAIALEQIKVIMDLVAQIKEMVFEGMFSPSNSA